MFSQDFYDEYGYFHANSFFDKRVCKDLKSSFLDEIKKCKKPKLRQRSVDYELHCLNKGGLIKNALLNVHSASVSEYPFFKIALQNLLLDSFFVDNLKKFLGENSVLIQTMYFESSKGTAAHFDRLFLSTNNISKMIGVWVALEDIDSAAGRFYLYPKSHLQNESKNKKESRLLILEYEKYNSIAVSGHLSSRKQQVKAVVNARKVLEKIIRINGWKKLTPALKQGDIIFFSPKTLHGSDSPSSDIHSRHSLTGHYISADQTNIRFGGVEENVDAYMESGLRVQNTCRSFLPKIIL